MKEALGNKLCGCASAQCLSFFVQISSHLEQRHQRPIEDHNDFQALSPMQSLRAIAKLARKKVRIEPPSWSGVAVLSTSKCLNNRLPVILAPTKRAWVARR